MANTRLAVGADGTVLTADSAEATGLKWAFIGGGTVNWTLLAKTADQQITGVTGMTDDSELQFTTTANTNYMIRIVIHANFAASASSLSWTHTGTTSKYYRLRRTLARAATNENEACDTADASVSFGFVNDEFCSSAHILLEVGGSGGTFKIQFDAPTAGQTSTILQGSTLEYFEI